MSMEIQGTITGKGQHRTGQGQKGPWELQEYILKTGGDYPKEVCFQVWNAKIQKFGIRANDQVTVSVDPASRSYTGNDGVTKWFTSLTAWKCEGGSGNAQQRPVQQPAPAQNNGDFDDDIPFN